MGYMRIKCHYCGGTWEVYARSVTNGDFARTCPHCFKGIERQTWEKQIIPAFHALDDANRELVKRITPAIIHRSLKSAMRPIAYSETVIRTARIWIESSYGHFCPQPAQN